MLIILVALSGVVGLVPMPTLAAVLIFAAVMSLRFGDIGVVWKTSHTGKIGMVVTFAVDAGAAGGGGGRGRGDLLAAAPAEQGADGPAGRPVIRNEDADSSSSNRCRRRCPTPSQWCWMCMAACSTPGRARSARGCPDPRRSKRPVVILRLRGRTSLGSTFFGVIASYADALEAGGWAAVPLGCAADMVDRFHRSQVQDVQGKIKVFHATEVIGASTMAAVEDARSWLVGEQYERRRTRAGGWRPERLMHAG